jgi:hypothetical protein
MTTEVRQPWKQIWQRKSARNQACNKSIYYFCNCYVIVFSGIFNCFKNDCTLGPTFPHAASIINTYEVMNLENMHRESAESLI